MDLLKKCQELYSELREAHDKLCETELKLEDPTTDTKMLPELYEQEFKYALQMSGAYEDLVYSLDKLQREREGMEFYINRVRRNADTLVYVEVHVDNNEI
jgi:hypothetical protein